MPVHIYLWDLNDNIFQYRKQLLRLALIFRLAAFIIPLLSLSISDGSRVSGTGFCCANGQFCQQTPRERTNESIWSFLATLVYFSAAAVSIEATRGHCWKRVFMNCNEYASKSSRKPLSVLVSLCTSKKIAYIDFELTISQQYGIVPDCIILLKPHNIHVNVIMLIL